jgi:uncharacterized protein (TIGR03437 family)
MHYTITGSSFNGLPVIETIPPGIPVRASIGISAGDAVAVRQAYGFPVEGVTIATNPPGLKLTVDGAEITGPAVFPWAPGEKHTIEAKEGTQSPEGHPFSRFRWARWSDDGERTHDVEIGSATKLIIANFVQEVQIRTAVNVGPGTVRIEPASPGGWYRLGSVVRVVPAPGPGLRFVRWFVLAGGTWVQGIFERGFSQDPAEFTVDRENLTYVARFVATPLHTVASKPTGRTISVDGQICVTPCTYEWAAASAHRLEAPATQFGTAGDRFQFLGWSNGGERIQSVTAGGTSTTYTADFQRQFLLEIAPRTRVVTTVLNRPSAASISVTPDAPDRYYNAGERVELTTVDGEGWAFGNWFGVLSGQTRPAAVVMNEETVVGATLFTSPLLLAESVVHDASRQPAGVSPRQVLTVFCHGLGVSGEIVGQRDRDGRFPTELAGWRVLFGDTPSGGIVSVGPGFIRVLVPSLPAGMRSVTLTIVNGARSGSVALSVLERNPAAYTRDGSGRGTAAAANEDGSPNSEETPAAIGRNLTIRATGFGELSAERLPVTLPAVQIGGRAAEILGVTPVDGQPEGVYDLTLRVAEGTPSGQQPLEFTGSRATSPSVTLFIR